jgi:hypothetical protein
MSLVPRYAPKPSPRKVRAPPPPRLDMSVVPRYVPAKYSSPRFREYRSPRKASSPVPRSVARLPSPGAVRDDPQVDELVRLVKTWNPSNEQDLELQPPKTIPPFKSSRQSVRFDLLPHLQIDISRCVKSNILIGFPKLEDGQYARKVDQVFEFGAGGLSEKDWPEHNGTRLWMHMASKIQPENRRRLKANTWLSDDIVDAFMSLLMRAQPKEKDYVVIPASAFDEYRQGKRNPAWRSLSPAYLDAYREFLDRKFGIAYAVRRVFVPFSSANTHWVLFEGDLATNRWVCHDSLNNGFSYLHHAKGWNADVYKLLRMEVPHAFLAASSVADGFHVPRQNDGNSCGLWACMTLFCRCFGLFFPQMNDGMTTAFQNGMRKYIIASVLDNGLVGLDRAAMGLSHRTGAIKSRRQSGHCGASGSRAASARRRPGANGAKRGLRGRRKSTRGARARS